MHYFFPFFHALVVKMCSNLYIVSDKSIPDIFSNSQRVFYLRDVEFSNLIYHVLINFL